MIYGFRHAAVTKQSNMSERSTLDHRVEIGAALCRQEVDRILAGETFGKSPRLCSLLSYICENSFLGRVDELTEQQIGIQVFQRSPGFNSGEDTIVRGTARHLRTRLDAYYLAEGKYDPVRISIPKGGYVATFSHCGEPRSTSSDIPAEAVASDSSDTARPLSVPTPARDLEGHWPLAAKGSLAFVSLIAVILGAIATYPTHRGAPDKTPLGPTPLWRALFTESRRTLIVPGDASLDAYIAWEQRPVSLDQYANQTYQREITVSQPPSATDVPLSVRSVTPMADLRLVAQLVQVSERLGITQAPKWIEIRYARDLAIADTHENNLILIGTESFNPWASLYQPQMDFKVGWDFHSDVYSVTNRAPKQGEPTRCVYRRDAPGNKALTLLAFLDNSQGHGHVLLVQGTSMGTTYAALNFLTNEHLWKPVIDAASAQDGSLRNFEVLLSSDFVRGGVSNTQLMAIHVH
jgi:hypothetical protein